METSTSFDKISNYIYVTALKTEIPHTLSTNINSYIESYYLCTHSQISLGKANAMCRACGTHGRGEKRVQGFGGIAQRKETTGKTKA
jgi:hypothetical protein